MNRGISSGHSQYGDIVRFSRREGETGWIFNTKPNVIRHKDYQGIYQFVVLVAGDGISPANARINVDYNGDWRNARPYDA